MSVQNHGNQKELAAVKFANDLQKFPIEVSVGVGIVLPNLINGCSWGFVTDSNTEYVKIIEEGLIDKNPNMASYRVKGGYLFNMDMSYLIKILSQVAEGPVTKNDLERASKHRMQAISDLEKFLAKGGVGKVGIYNLNDSPRITVRGQSYPSFCVTLGNLLDLCRKYGYGLRLGSKIRRPDEVERAAVQVIERLEIAPSGNALFIEVAKM